MTGLAASWVSGATAFEAAAVPGGICSSYYQCPGTAELLARDPEDGAAYHFENGGGHWIFGSGALTRRFLARFSPLETHQRVSAVYFPEDERFVSYPLQYHLGELEPSLARQAFEEMRRGAESPLPATLGGWLERTFGPALNGLFFRPFHDLYTAGLTDAIAPQDGFKTPIDLKQAERGLESASEAAGYNVSFLHPSRGLAHMAYGMAEGGRVEYGKRAVSADLARQTVEFGDGSGARFERLVSTLPLDRTLELCGVELDRAADPYTSVIVLNLGGLKGPKHPPHHWLYVPRSRSGFHRVGIYSNVSRDFVPGRSVERTSMYIERALPGGSRLAKEEEAAWARSVIEELKSWGWLGEEEAWSATWIDTAYTWRRPGSSWREEALQLLESRGVVMAGRYACWKFQGIAESIRDGFSAGAAIK